MKIRGAFLVIVTLALACAAFAAGGLVWTTLAQVRTDLSGSRVTSSLESGPQASLIYDRDDTLTHSLFTEQRIDVALSEVSPVMVQAVLAAEDHRFYDHFGLDPVRMAGAAAANLKARRIVEGGSTITQQLARNLELGRQRTWSRKIREVILAAEIEARHSKDTILETYLNTAYFGEGYYGVEAASRGYFDKPASGLEPDEAALLAGLLRAPSANSPNKTPDGATTVRNLVLRAMRDRGVMTDEDMRRYVAEPLRVKPRRSNGLTAHVHAAETACGLYYFEEVRKQLVDMFGEDQVLEGGLRVFTSYDPRAQHAAERAIAQRLAQLAPSPRLRSASSSALQGALVAMEPRTGHVIALVGGRDFHQSSFNRATQAHRQPGSAFKPFVWAAAVERGWAPGTVLTGLDAPIGDGTWMPSGDHEAESYTLRRALTVSSNRAAAQLMQQVGMSSTIYTARRLGIESDLPPVPSLALGTGEVTLLEMVSAYGALANEGVWTRPTLITRVEDASGAVLYAAPFDQRRAVSTGTAYLMNSMMSDVVNRGTGWRARQAGFTLPAAGKTGTSDDYADAWFVGYTPGVVAGVWFGHDRRKTIRKSYASDIAVPAWAAFMREATRGHKAVWYEMPSDVEKVDICRASGHRAGDACRRSPGYARVMLLDGSMVDREVQGGVATELFTLGSAPYGECPLHSGLYLDASYELAPMPELPELSDLASDLAMPAMPRGMSELSGSLTSDDLSSPLFKASEAVGTSGVTPAPRATPAPPPTALPPIPVSPSLPSATKPALGTIPRAGTPNVPGAPKLPGTPVRKPGGGITIESVVKSDGTTVTVIRDHRGGG
ncbi:MAG TPA: PBP1A family penicillin-binding protein [Vicinamibacterales bacterium]|nr:PBP1A family penicillin-binding protein [Vicinamibacterales bacterium]